MSSRSSRGVGGTRSSRGQRPRARLIPVFHIARDVSERAGGRTGTSRRKAGMVQSRMIDSDGPAVAGPVRVPALVKSRPAMRNEAQGTCTGLRSIGLDDKRSTTSVIRVLRCAPRYPEGDVSDHAGIGVRGEDAWRERLCGRCVAAVERSGKQRSARPERAGRARKSRSDRDSTGDPTAGGAGQIT